jgi:hypothetical protein
MSSAGEAARTQAYRDEYRREHIPAHHRGALHTAHHDPHLMARYNFNISYPLGDWLCGTLYRGAAPPGDGTN